MTLNKLPDWLPSSFDEDKIYKKPNPQYTVVSAINTIRLGSWELNDFAIVGGLSLLTYSVVLGMVFPYDVIIEKAWVETLYQSAGGVNKNQNIVSQRLTASFPAINWSPKRQTNLSNDTDRRVYRSQVNPNNKKICFEGDVLVQQQQLGSLVDVDTWVSAPTVLNDVIGLNFYLQLRPLTNSSDRS